MPNTYRYYISVLMLALAVPPVLTPAHADAKLAAIFSDNMILQQGRPLTIWGTAAPNEKVTVSLGENSGVATADAGGKWRVSLPAANAGTGYELTVQAANSLRVKNVAVGEVWFASGQSNMQFPLKKAANAEEAIAAANDPDLREFTVKPQVSETPRADVSGQWRSAEGSRTGEFSAVAYFFARELRAQLQVPIGIVHASQGWTPAEAWMSREALQNDPEFKRDILDKWDGYAAAYPTAIQAYNQQLKDWEQAKTAAAAADQPLPPKPKRPPDPAFIHRATGLWNGSVAPLLPYGIRGVIWYQGETNDNRGYQYRKLFPALIKDWRRQWNQSAMPFLWVQLASVLPPDPEPAESEWSEVREAQAMALTLPHTGMAVTLDIGEEKDVHPKNKQAVGHRLALCALAKVYGQHLEYSGPVLRAFKVEGAKIRLSFDHSNAGLATDGGGELRGFAIAGQDRSFHWAAAKIEGDQVVVWSDGVPNPVAVRYAWANNPMPNSNFVSRLKNGEQLPAGPFRTDDWPGKSFGVTTMPIESMG